MYVAVFASFGRSPPLPLPFHPLYAPSALYIIIITPSTAPSFALELGADLALPSYSYRRLTGKEVHFEFPAVAQE